MISEIKNPMMLKWDQGTLLLEGWPREVSPSTIAPNIWKWDSRVSKWRSDAIHYFYITNEFAQRSNFCDEVPKPVSVCWPNIDLPTLRIEQTEALDGWMKSGCRGQVIMPTGTGKTEVALAAMTKTNIATLVVAPVRDLMYQWHRRILKGLGYDAGIVGDNTFNIKPITVTTYDSAYIHMSKMGAGFGLLIFDEEHHLPGKYRREAALLSTAPMRLGLTATPERSDGLHKDLAFLIGPVAYDMPFDQAKGTLADFDVVRIPVALSDHEQQRYDQCSQEIREYIASQRKENPGYKWQDLCKESGKDPQARSAQKAFHLKTEVLQS